MSYQVGDLFRDTKSNILGTIIKITQIQNNIYVEWSDGVENVRSNRINNYDPITITSNLVWKSWIHYPVVK